MSGKSLLSRLERLERDRAAPAPGSGVVHLSDGESQSDAAKRLGLPDMGGRIVVSETLTAEVWQERARHQQSQLIHGQREQAT